MLTNSSSSGDWGLNYDDGPFNLAGEEALDKWAEPELYNFLAKTNDQKASLFYIGSNVATYPEAAKRALNNGHVLCVHTWSHPQMTTQSNEKVVAELYWTLRAIKEATGITTKCWRPPYGDVDDRVRAIAHQMGLQTILWDEDTVREIFAYKLLAFADFPFFLLERLGHARRRWRKISPKGK